MVISYNIATYLKGILKITNDKDEPKEADVQIQESGFDPVDSVRLTVKPKSPGWLTCHLLFPEISTDRIPDKVSLGCEVFTPDTNIIIDGADPHGPCIEIPFRRDGAWCFGKNEVDIRNANFMVWKTKSKRKLESPIRIKYVLLISREGHPIDVSISKLSLHYE